MHSAGFSKNASQNSSMFFVCNHDFTYLEDEITENLLTLKKHMVQLQ